MNQDGASLLAQLRDIHGAPPVAWWPPAPGWWLLALLTLAILGFLLSRLWRSWRVQSRRRHLVQELEAMRLTLDPHARPQEYLAAINRVLKSVAIRAFPDEDCARMQGARWTGFLHEKLAPAAPTGIEALAEGPYRPTPPCEVEALDGLARLWINRYG